MQHSPSTSLNMILSRPMDIQQNPKCTSPPLRSSTTTNWLKVPALRKGANTSMTSIWPKLATSTSNMNSSSRMLRPSAKMMQMASSGPAPSCQSSVLSAGVGRIIMDNLLISHSILNRKIRKKICIKILV